MLDCLLIYFLATVVLFCFHFLTLYFFAMPVLHFFLHYSVPCLCQFLSGFYLYPDRVQCIPPRTARPLFHNRRHFLYASRLAHVNSCSLCPPQSHQDSHTGLMMRRRSSVPTASRRVQFIIQPCLPCSSEPRWGQTSSHHQISFPDVMMNVWFVLTPSFFLKGKF